MKNNRCTHKKGSSVLQIIQVRVEIEKREKSVDQSAMKRDDEAFKGAYFISHKEARLQSQALVRPKFFMFRMHSMRIVHRQSQYA